MSDNINNKFYERYVHQYAKRFYTPFTKENIFVIVHFAHTTNMDYIICEDEHNNLYNWDVEDCIFITNETPIIEDERVTNVNHEKYLGYNPFKIN